MSSAITTSEGAMLTAKVFYVSTEPVVACEYLAYYGDTLTPADVTEITGVTEQTVRSLCESGEIPCVKMGRRYVIPKPGFIAYLYGRKVS